MADFQEVADSLRALLEEAKNNPLEILDPNTVEFSKRIAIQTANQSQSQKHIANDLGQQFVVAKQLGFLSRKRALDAKLLTDISSEIEDRVRNELDVIDEIVSQNDELLRSIHEQASAHGDLIGDTIQLNVHEERHAEIVAEIAAIKFEMASMDADARKNAKTQIDNLEDEAESRKVMSLQEKKDARVSALRNKQQEVFGISQDGINDKIDEMGGLLSTTAGRLTLIAMVMKTLLTPVIDHMKELRNLGLTWSQTMEASAATVSSMMDRGFVRGLLTMRSTAEVTIAMRSDFADMTFQSAELVALGGELVTSFKLSGAEAAELLEVFAKVSGFSADSTENILHMARAFGQINNIRPAALLQAVAQHAGVFARFGEQGADAFFRSVTAAERLGIELSQIESTADAFLDIDSFFQDVSKLRTLGIDIADPFGLAQIAQSGTPEELLKELQRQMQGIDLTQMGRVQRNALASALSMNVADLSRLIQGPTGGIETPTGAQIAELGDFAGGMGGAVDALGEMVSGLGNISNLLMGIIALMALNQLGGAGKLLSGARKLLSLTRGAQAGGLVLESAASAAGLTGTSAGAGLFGIGAGTIAATLGGAALAAGAGAAAFKGTDMLRGAMGMRTMSDVSADRQTIKARSAGDAAEDRRHSRIIADRMAREDMIRSQMPGASADDLARAFRQVKVDMDGRTVGELTYRASHPASQR